MRISLILSALALLLPGCAPAPDAPAEPAAAPETVRGTLPAPDGVTIAHTLRGRGEPTLVFLHGWMGDQSLWEAAAEAFDDTHRVVTVDLPGHGASGADRTEWTVSRLAADVAAVLAGLDLREVVLVGHSMSGPVSLEAAPLSGGRVRAVIGVDTLHDASMKFDPAQWEELMQRFEADFPGTCREFVASMVRPGGDPALVSRLQGSMCDGPQDVALALLRGFGTYDMAGAMSRAGVPVRAINGDMMPTNVEGNRALADFAVKILPGVGHFPMLERPDEFHRLLRETLAELPARRSP